MIKKIIKISYFIYMMTFSFPVLASLSIQEVMYNPDGADTNREWIEVYNNGNSLDISSWYFLENDTYHGLSPDGFTQLAQGERALIVKDLASARASLGGNIKYIKSSFSLNNSGETLVIADNNKNTVDSYTYNADDGANGDGKSLQYISGEWKASIPTPGKENVYFMDVSGSNNNNNDDNISDTSNFFQENTKQIVHSSKPYYKASLVVPDVIVSQSDFNFSVEVDYIVDGVANQEIDGYFVINFGDGKRKVSKKKIKESYRYRNPGNYVFVFAYYTSQLAYNNGEEPDASLKKIIQVLDNKVYIEKVNFFDGIVIHNATAKMVDISNWKIVLGKYHYSFPENSFILGKSSISIIPSILGFPLRIDQGEKIQLLTASYSPISSFPRKQRVLGNNKKYSSGKKSQKKSINKKQKVKDKNKTDKEEVFIFNDLDNANVDFFGNNKDAFLEDYLKKHPNKVKVSFSSKSEGEKINKQNNKKEDYSIYYLLGSLLLMLSVGRIIKHHYEKNNKEDNNNEDDYGNIKLIE